MVKNKRGLVQDSFANCVEYNANGTVKTTSIKQTLSTAPMNPPINFAKITARDFMIWIVSMKKPNGSYHSFAAYAGHRSAFFNLFQDYHCVSKFAAEFALASLVYHLEFLRAKLTQNHPLFQSALLADSALLNQLETHIQRDTAPMNMQPTDVPPHVSLLSEIRAVRNDLRAELESRKADMQTLKDD
ncbi:hypothetical protein PHMEG_00012229 [Phytophthora megakarya]|uniref:Uncharacterized protein n=1 Tax=Phytophthora megakarya TaxID=4795 RepID=A0A225W9N8_9STRA|nr:hypothetical protein PHMEG_00012229 [Phytophthora megakarya]